MWKAGSIDVDMEDELGQHVGVTIVSNPTEQEEDCRLQADWCGRGLVEVASVLVEARCWAVVRLLSLTLRRRGQRYGT